MPYADPAKQREYQRRWIAQRRADWFADKSCVVCGGLEELELDHLDPKQKVDHKVWSWSESRRLEELAKCVVRCKQHHLVKSNGEKRHGPSHPVAVLSTAQVEEAKRRVAAGETQAEVALSYGVTKWCIWRIVHGVNRRNG